MGDMLVLDHLSVGYGEAVVLPDLSLTLCRGEVLALLGRNGTGKTTLLGAIIGVVRHFRGGIVLDAKDVTSLRPDQRARAGIGWVPQERNIFKSLTVEENMSAVAQPGEWTPQRVYALFPRLKERRGNFGNQLSGGEQQMLAIGRALVLNPKVLLLDEPTEGLAPVIVDELMAALRELSQVGIAMIVVEQSARKVLKLADRAVILDRGEIAHEALAATLREDKSTLERLLGVASSSQETKKRKWDDAQNQTAFPRR